MKTKYLLLILSGLTAIALTGCKKDFTVKSDFNYNNPNCVIVDNLENVTNKTAHIALLYGQSNADGVSHNSYLQANDEAKYNEYVAGYDNVLLNYYNDGGATSSNYTFQKATLGCGCASYTYGPEIGMAEVMSKTYPDEQSFIIKWTWGGTALRHQWLDGSRGRGDLYNSAMDFSIKCLRLLLSKGYTLSIEGICWMQGESDAWESDWKLYYKDTVAFVSYLRHDLKSFSDKIKFIDAGINEEAGVWPNPKSINKAKQEFASESDLNIYVDTPALGLTTKHEPSENPDLAHYDSISMVKLGQAFGNMVVGK